VETYRNDSTASAHVDDVAADNRQDITPNVDHTATEYSQPFTGLLAILYFFLLAFYLFG